MFPPERLRQGARNTSLCRKVQYVKDHSISKQQNTTALTQSYFCRNTINP
jgi:hypothetical protein